MKEYTRLEYIEADGNQWIDSDIKAGYNIRIFADFEYTKTSPLQQRLFGATVDNNNTNLFCLDFYINGSGHYAWACSDGNGNWQGTSITANTGRHTIDIDSRNGIVQMDEGVFYSYTMTTTRTKISSRNIYLFSTNYNTTGIVSSKNTYAKIYSCKIYDNGVLVRDFLPVKDNNGVCGLYDRVSGTFSPSQGSSAFIGGSEIDTPLSFPYGFRRRLLSSCNSSESGIVRQVYSSIYSTTYTIPNNCVKMDLFLVGAGGGGAGASYANGRCGSGGNGGEAKLFTINNPPKGTSFYVYRGVGGWGGNHQTEEDYNLDTKGGDGESTYCAIDGITYIAKGGSGGVDAEVFYDYCGDTYWQDYQRQLQPNGNLGGYGCIWGSQGQSGRDGVVCEFLNNGYKYGASGAGGSDCYNISSYQSLGGQTGGGNGGYGTDNTVLNDGCWATFYGGGGGGGGFSSNHVYGNGGDGENGFSAVCFYVEVPKAPQYKNTSWICLGTANTGGTYRKFTYSVQPDKKVYAIATTSLNPLGGRWCSRATFYEDPLNPNSYQSAWNCENTYQQKNFEHLYVSGKKSLWFQCNDYSSRVITYYEIDGSDIIPSQNLANVVNYEMIKVNGTDLNTYVYYFEQPMYLSLVQAAFDVENWYILVDNETLSDPRGGFKNWV